MYRVRDDQPLMIDLNLLGFRFNTALANALERAFAQPEEFVVAKTYPLAVAMKAAAGAD